MTRLPARRDTAGLPTHRPHPEETPMPAQTPAEIAIAAYDAAVNAELGNEPGTVFGDEGRRNLLDHPAFAAMLAAHERAVLIAAGQKLRDWADEKYPDPFGPTGTRRRAILASARKVEPEPTSAEVGAALTRILGGMPARHRPDAETEVAS